MPATAIFAEIMTGVSVGNRADDRVVRAERPAYYQLTEANFD
jgi:hypothetical protein